MIHSTLRASLLAAAIVVLVVPAALAQRDMRTERVRFERGANAVIEGSITGYDIVDYVLGARADRYTNVGMATDDGGDRFDVLAPGEGEVAMFDGAIGENQYEGILPESGDFKVPVHRMRSAARRDEVAHHRLGMIIAAGEEQSGAAHPARKPAAVDVPPAPENGGPRDWVVAGVSSALNLRAQPSTTAQTIASYAPGTVLDNLGCLRAEGRVWCDVQELGGGPRGYVAAEFLTPAVSPDGTVATGPDTSALRAGRGDFDATGRIPCAQHAGQPMTQCDFGVARAGGGYATIVITKPDGRTRALYFRNGTPIGADTSEADGHGEFSAEKESDLNLIRVGSERYEVPDAVILGG